jgi:glycosyltransferase involved in cell wall biosynthesis
LSGLKEKWNLNNVEFTGFLSKDKLFEYLPDYHFSIIPSVWYDNMPNSYIESQAAGLPVIVSSIGSLREMTVDGNNGFLFESENTSQLAEIIEKAYQFDSDSINYMSENSINWVKDYCSENKHYERLMEIFNKAINKNEKTD